MHWKTAHWKTAWCIWVLLVVLGGQGPVLAEEAKDPGLIVDKARIILKEMMQSEDNSIPKDLIRQCSGLAIIPGMIKGGFFVGGSYGQGVVLKHQRGKWTGPAFLDIVAGSFGVQIGVEAVDLILVAIGPRALDSFLKSKFKLGGDVAVAAGPIGAHATAATDILLQGGIFSYSRSKGLFAGVSLEGAVIIPRSERNQAYYQTTGDTTAILAGDIQPRASGQALIDALAPYR
jgi:lipid-binding SYLF domain-containing protein